MKFKLKPITKINKFHYKGKVHDLTVNKNHSYNVFNIIVHNSICSTRTQTGFGVPLLTAVEDCAAVKDNSLLVADGGMKNAGDLMKAIAFGADLCMLGKMLAATDLAPGDCYSEQKHQTSRMCL
jgi:isopentenyl diphosphate isomerase/L-lactate dehydrogenase-like FMN-dependent dehydrogenase